MVQSPASVLSMALYFSVPPVSAIVLSNVFVIDKTFAIVRLIGDRLSRPVLLLAALAFHALHAFTHVYACSLLLQNCRLNNEFIFYTLPETTEQCVPSIAGVALLRLCLLWTDRVIFSLLDLPRTHTLGAKYRIVNGALIVAAFSALAVQEPLSLVLLLQSFASRTTGSGLLDRRLWPLKYALRAYAAFASVVCVYTGGARTSASRRSAGVVALVAASGH